MTDPSYAMLPPNRLALLFELDTPPHWSLSDAPAALRHQLAAPLLPDLANAPGSHPHTLDHLVQQHPGTFQTLLLSPAPNLELLETLKSWARQLRDDPSTPLSPGPATVLYYAAIAAALTGLNQRITSLTNEQLHEGFSWALDQDGAQALRPLFEKALTHLSSRRL